MKESSFPTAKPSQLLKRAQVRTGNQTHRTGIQPKVATSKSPAAPAVYRPQPVPKVLQRKTVTTQQLPTPIHRPQKVSVRPSIATPSQKPKPVSPARKLPQNGSVQLKAPVTVRVERRPSAALPPRAVPGRTFPTVQMKATVTGLKRHHAAAVYKNHYKGDPPFKPQKGNFGKVSWFAGTGNAYVGGQAQNYDVTVAVDVPEPRPLDKEYFNTFLASYLKAHPEVNLDDTSTHGAFWAALGHSLEGYGVSEVFIPQGKLSRQGSGTFIAVNSEARMRVRLTNPAQLRTDLVAIGENVQAIEQQVNAKEGTHAASFSIRLNSISHQIRLKPNKTLMNGPEFLGFLGQRLAGYGIVRPQSIQNLVFAAVPAPQGAYAAMAALGAGTRYSLSATFVYANYKTARNQAKLWAVAANTLLLRNDCGGLTITKGHNWSDKAIRSYTAVY